MAERLTNKIGYEYEKAKRETQLLEINNKLGKIEDIMEKHGIESVEELDELIQKVDALILKASQGARLNKKIEKLQQDRDTWKKACEDATPKFKVKEFVYTIFSDKDIFKGQIDSYDYYSKCYLIFFNDDLGSEWIPRIFVFKTKNNVKQYLYQQAKEKT